MFKASEKKQIIQNLTEVLKSSPDASPTMIEVFCPGRFKELAEKFGVRCQASFDLSGGWDWRVKEHRKRAEEIIALADPDLLVMSPPCGPLSRLQECTPMHKRVDPQQFQREVVEAKVMVGWCARLARERAMRGKSFVLESSHTSEAWTLVSMQRLMRECPGKRLSVPACAVGLVDPESKKPFGKKWGFYTNLETIALTSEKLVCSGDHEHQTVEGRSGGMLRSVRTQAYPTRLLKTILGGLACHDHYEACCYPVSQETLQPPVALKGEGLQRVRAAIKKMHVNLGHASVEDMTRILRHHGAQAPVLELVKAFSCDVCDARKAPKAVKDSSVPRDLAPLRYIGLDVKWLPTWKKDYNIKALNVVCRASGFQQMYPFRETENSELLVRLFRNWTRAFGRPRYCKFDASRCNLGQPFLDMLERDGTTALDVPGEAHEQMGDVEVQGRHFCTMLVKVIDDMQPEDYNQWLECVDVTTEAKNMLMRRGGYSANQMVFGRDPEVPGDDLLGSNPNPISNGAIVEDAIAEFSHRARMSARKAVLEALDHRAARIALNSRPRPLREFRPGDEVAVWRRGRGIKKSMARWRGPGIVAGETGGNYWVSMPGSFVKCAPEQLRLRTTEEREADRFLVRDLRAAATQLFPEVGPSNKTQKSFMDITKDDYPPGELFVHQPSNIPDCRPEVAVEGPIPMAGADSQPSQSRRESTVPETISSEMPSLPESDSRQRQISQMSEHERHVGGINTTSRPLGWISKTPDR